MITLNPEPIRRVAPGSASLNPLKYEVFRCKIHYSGCTAVILTLGPAFLHFSGHESRILCSGLRFPCGTTPARVLRKAAASCSKRCFSVRMLPRGLQMHRTLNPQPLQLAALKPKPSTIVSTGVANDPRFSNAFETSICKAPLDRGVWGVDNP